MKMIPNMITALRIICSIVLLFIKPLSKTFFILYILCGISDLADGYIARRNKWTSQLGTMFDSIADTIFIGVLLLLFIPLFPWKPWMLCWIGAIALMRFASLIVGFVKYHSAAFLHTYLNKITGGMLFCFPVLYNGFGLHVTVCLLCTTASASAIEELLINATSQTLSRDVHSIFIK